MNIKPFIIDDLGSFLPNKFSSPDEIFPIMLGMEVQTMWGEDDYVQAFICAHNYWGNCWRSFMLVAKNFDPSNNAVVRALIHETMKVRNAQRLETTSVSCEELKTWHEYLGFTLEGTKRKMMFNRDYDCWAIVREGA